MLLAVSVLSPVNIQTLIPAFINDSKVEGTSGWSWSSIALTPKTCKFDSIEEIIESICFLFGGTSVIASLYFWFQSL